IRVVLDRLADHSPTEDEARAVITHIRTQATQRGTTIARIDKWIDGRDPDTLRHDLAHIRPQTTHHGPGCRLHPRKPPPRRTSSHQRTDPPPVPRLRPPPPQTPPLPHVRHRRSHRRLRAASRRAQTRRPRRSEEHTSELQSREKLVCRLLLEKKKPRQKPTPERR